MRQIRSSFDTKLKVSVTITLFLHMGESRTRVNFSLIIKLILHVLLATRYIDRFIKPVLPAVRKIVSDRSSLVPTSMVHKASNEHEMEKSDSL